MPHYRLSREREHEHPVVLTIIFHGFEAPEAFRFKDRRHVVSLIVADLQSDDPSGLMNLAASLAMAL